MELEKNAGPPRIESFQCYRQFMREMYQYKKTQRASFSYRQFSQRVGVRSPNYMQLVMQGKRNLSNTLSLSVAKAFALNATESRYFTALVAWSNAEGETEKVQTQKELLLSTKDLVSKLLPQSQKEILTKWYHMVVRELVDLPGFEYDGRWVASKLRGLLTDEEAQASLDTLCKAGMITYENGKWEVAEPVVSTGEAFDSIRINKYHSETLKVWGKHFSEFLPEDREVGLLNIAIHPSKVPELKQKVKDFQSEIIGWLQDEDSPQQVVQLGIYMIPITTKNS